MCDQPDDTTSPDNQPHADADEVDPGAPEEIYTTYRATLDRIERLPELEMRIATLDGALRPRPARETAWWLDQMVRGALWGKSPEIDAMMAGCVWLIRARLDDDYDLIKTVFEAAHDDGREAIVALLRNPPPHQALPDGKQLRRPKLDLGRDVTVGEKRQMARRPDRGVIDQLLMDPNPLVVDQLLSNPNVREQDVLLVSTRRPNTPEILVEIALNGRWFKRREVRYSIVMNPYAGTGLALKLLPTLGIQKLRKVTHATHIHPTLIKAAQVLVELRERRTAPWRV